MAPTLTTSLRELLLDGPKPDLRDPQLRAEALGCAPLFQSWPAPALLRLARAASVASRAPGALVVASGPTAGVLTVIVGGTALPA